MRAETIVGDYYVAEQHTRKARKPVISEVFASFRVSLRMYLVPALLALLFVSPLALNAQVTPPSTPGGFTAIATSDSKVSMSWGASTAGTYPLSTYRIYRGDSPSNLQQIAKATKLTYIDTTAIPGATYYYAVAAADTHGNLSPQSTPVMVVMPNPPSPPTDLSGKAISSTSIKLTWTAAVSGGLPIKYYLILRGDSPSTLLKIATVKAPSISYTNTGLAAGTYYYAVEAQDSGLDTSPMSNVINVTLTTPPSAPSGLTGTPISSSKLSLTWNSSVPGGLPIAYYLVLRGASSSTLKQVATVTQASYMDTTLKAGQTYYYAVEAEDTGKDLSPESNIFLDTQPTPPAPPTNVTPTPTNATILSLVWAPSVSGGLPVEYYQVYRGTSPTTLQNLGTVQSTYYTDQKLVPGATYYYAVTAEDSGQDYSAKSTPVPATMYNNPSAPGGLATTLTSNIPPGAPQASYTITFTWNAAGSGGLPINFYTILRGTSPTSLSQLAQATQTQYTDMNLVAGNTYYYALVATDTGGDASPQSGIVHVTINGNVKGSFNILPMTITSFMPDTSNMPGIPTVSTVNGIVPDLGYQEGKVMNGKAIYFPWQVANGGSSWIEDINDGIPHSVILSYDATQGVNGFTNAANWTYFDLSTLSWYSKGGLQPGNLLPNLPAGFQGGAVQGSMVYPAPKAGAGGPLGGGGPYPVFIQYDSSKALNDPTAYQTFVPPPETSQVMGYTYGWCNAVSDGRFIYYAPLSNAITGNSGNIFRYDTTQPFGNPDGGVPSAWANFDVHQAPAFNPGGLDPNAQGFQAVVYDGHRYVYLIPFNATLIVRYDTWGGGTGPDPAAFTKVANYVAFDPTQLGTTGYPPISGQGSAANLQGFTGATVVWDANNQNEYLYLVPWATFPNNAQNPVSQTTAARVRIGIVSSGTWHAVDITSTTGTPPNWQMYDLNLLTQNPAWPTQWPLFSYNPELANISSLAGYQSAFVATQDSTGPIPPRVGLVPDTSLFLVEHDVGHNLYDPTGWYVSEIPLEYSNGTMGGGYDAVNAIHYPASPNVPFYAFQF